MTVGQPGVLEETGSAFIDRVSLEKSGTLVFPQSLTNQHEPIGWNDPRFTGQAESSW